MAEPQAVPQQQVVSYEEICRQYGELCIQEKLLLSKKMVLEQHIQAYLNQQPIK